MSARITKKTQQFGIRISLPIAKRLIKEGKKTSVSEVVNRILAEYYEAQKS